MDVFLQTFIGGISDGSCVVTDYYSYVIVCGLYGYFISALAEDYDPGRDILDYLFKLGRMSAHFRTVIDSRSNIHYNYEQVAPAVHIGRRVAFTVDPHKAAVAAFYSEFVGAVITFSGLSSNIIQYGLPVFIIYHI